jgi:hypothetical protein
LCLHIFFFWAQFTCTFFTWMFSRAEFTIGLVFTRSFRVAFTISRLTSVFTILSDSFFPPRLRLDHDHGVIRLSLSPSRIDAFSLCALRRERLFRCQYKPLVVVDFQTKALLDGCRTRLFNRSTAVVLVNALCSNVTHSKGYDEQSFFLKILMLQF